ncbi:MAG: hypothetical protein L3J28_04010 [Candidatus Polarisedimenticolaceae bacterium]|nr:hypothetical protein [Candidatus Polarisedimenticolaceae bacterium]
MKIYLHLESDEIDEVAEAIITAISDWLKEGKSGAQLVNSNVDEGAEGGRSGWDIGLTIETSKKSILAKPLNFLYELAKKERQEFVVGIYDEAKASYENVCYFGYEEGKPDPYEVASYLGLPK